MADRVLLLTGRLAMPRLAKILAGLGETDFSWSIRDMGVKVAALMTEAIIMRRLTAPINADRVIVPGRVGIDLTRLSSHFGVPFERGPDEAVDLPAYFGRGGAPVDLTRHDMRIFAEIVDAPACDVATLVVRAQAMREAGADVIDIGCLPDVPFPHLEEAIAALKAEGLAVSVDSADPSELRRGALAGADAVLSLNSGSLDIAADTGVEVVLVPASHGDLESLCAAAEEADRRGIRFMADPVLDPIHFGFAASLMRYAEFRRRMPEAEMLMGTGNLTELTDVDSSGVTAVLLGMCSELGIRNVLVVHVSPHTRRTIEEHDCARRQMYAARADGALPRDYSGALLQLHDRRPFGATPAEIAAAAAEVRDDNYRIEVAEDGIHLYNARGHHVAQDAMTLYPSLAVEQDGAHAFYLGTELMKAEIAFMLGKRFAQDAPLDWGVGADRRIRDLGRLAEAGHTMRARRKD